MWFKILEFYIGLLYSVYLLIKDILWVRFLLEMIKRRDYVIWKKNLCKFFFEFEFRYRVLFEDIVYFWLKVFLCEVWGCLNKG